MLCAHCQKRVPEKGYCCEKAELDTLRTVVDEAARTLDAECAELSIGAADIADNLRHLRHQLRRARVA